jgi:hypothetical protein
MANLSRNFIKGRMNKSVDERLVPNGEYIDALNVRLGSTEDSEIGVIENAKGNTRLTDIVNIVDGSYSRLEGPSTKCIGAYADSANQTIYWFIHAEDVLGPSNGILDLIVSFNERTDAVRYHVVSSRKDGTSPKSTLNFNSSYLITAVDLIDGLLFFTDNYNPPRFINVNRSYGLPDSSTYIDSPLLDEQLLVIKKPPLSPPSLNLLSNGQDENFLEEEIVSFAYRYKYADGEYSATSPFSEPAFMSRAFGFTPDEFLNDGMVNEYNAVELTYNTGSELVVGIDILFKRTDDSVIKVIQKIDKGTQNLSNNSDEVYRFDKSKVYTILPSSEILRLYDNVPVVAKAQTLMGNRLMYGNYKEGYDISSNIDYRAELVTDSIGSKIIDATFSQGQYTLDPSVTRQIPSSIASFDLGSSNIANPEQEFVAGAILDFSLSIEHSRYDIYPSPSSHDIINVTPRFEVTFSFTLDRDYNSASEIFSSQSFLDFIGTASNIKTVVSEFCDGQTVTDFFNCSTEDTLIGESTGGTHNYLKNHSGIDNPNEPIAITSSSGSDTLSLQILATYYRHSGTEYLYEYYKINSASCVFTSVKRKKSLHSNRDYSVGMIYMDDYGRQSTVLTSDENTIHVPCGNSPFSNKVKVTIPSTQAPPSWATHYKFAIKADVDTYETIYSNIYFTKDNFGYLLLEGENAAKIQEGDILVLKADSSGPVVDCTEVTIIEKEAYTADDIASGSPAGVYAKIGLDVITLVDNSDSIIRNFGTNPQRKKNSRDEDGAYNAVSIFSGGSAIEIAAGDKITIKIDVIRHGSTGFVEGSLTRFDCPRKEYRFDRTFVSPSQYTTFYDWFQGENIQTIIEEDGITVGDFDVRFRAASDIGPSTNTAITGFNLDFGFDADSAAATEFRCRTMTNCSDNTVAVKLKIEVLKVSNVVVLETKPIPTNPDIFYEGDETFTITEGSHDTDTPTLSFFNCFSFGNGVESYKIKDSVTGMPFALGNRATSVSSEDYREAHRFADITYSGIYNDESNVNKLNEFNLGLLNFKRLEERYGVITLLDGRETDVFTLQEDKISYVLAGKNLLSDAAAGSAITSVPEVLGTQIARIEDYGNSLNPESYVQWGTSKYFTDAKRGAVIQLKGQGRSEALSVISEFGMRSWFRDLFIEGFNTQKLGAFDPYMNEYVLASNNNEVPVEEQCIDCGTSVSNIIVSSSNNYSFCTDLDNALGDSVISWSLSGTPLGSVTVSAVSGTDSVTANIVGGGPSSGSMTLVKSDSSTKKVTITITHVSGEPVVFQDFTVNCVDGDTITVVTIVLTDNVDANKTIQTQYSYGTQSKVTNLITFEPGAHPNSSLYSSFTGYQGLSRVPVNGSTVNFYANKLSSDTYDVNVFNNKFRYLVSNTLYANTRAGLQLILDNATEVSISGSDDRYNGSFTMPSANPDDYLYLVWDFRNPTAIDVCFDAVGSAQDACCNCVCYSTECTTYTVDFGLGNNGLITYQDCTNGFITRNIVASEDVCVAAGAPPPQVVSGRVDSISIKQDSCNCGGTLRTPSATPKVVKWIDGNDFSRATVLSDGNDSDKLKDTAINHPTQGWYSDGNVARFIDSSNPVPLDLSPNATCLECEP